MKRILSLVIVIAMLFTLCGCAKLINTEYEEVEVKVTDVYRRGLRIVGRTTYPSKHRVMVEYNNSEYVINGRETYNKYKDKVGQTVNGVLETRTYDDGTVKYNITELK